MFNRKCYWNIISIGRSKNLAFNEIENAGENPFCSKKGPDVSFHSPRSYSRKDIISCLYCIVYMCANNLPLIITSLLKFDDKQWILWILFKFVSNFCERAIFLFSNFLLCEQEQRFLRLLLLRFVWYTCSDFNDIPLLRPNYWSQVRDPMTNWVFFLLIFRCPPDNDLGFPHFAATTQGPGPGGLSSMTSYLKTAPYIMTVDSLHSMGYPTPGKLYLL